MVQAGILKDWTKASSVEQYLLYMISWSYSEPPWKIQGLVECKYGKVGRDLTCEAEEEGKKPVEMSLTKDPAEANTQDDVEVFRKALKFLFEKQFESSFFSVVCNIYALCGVEPFEGMKQIHLALTCQNVCVNKGIFNAPPPKHWRLTRR